MVVLLCIVIFSELSLANSIEDNKTMIQFFYMSNFSLLSFFILEISARLLTYGFEFFDFINIFDSTVVIISFTMMALTIESKVRIELIT
jgi:hypothetical protein